MLSSLKKLQDRTNEEGAALIEVVMASFLITGAAAGIVSLIILLVR